MALFKVNINTCSLLKTRKVTIKFVGKRNECAVKSEAKPLKHYLNALTAGLLIGPAIE